MSHSKEDFLIIVSSSSSSLSSSLSERSKWQVRDLLLCKLRFRKNLSHFSHFWRGRFLRERCSPSRENDARTVRVGIELATLLGALESIVVVAVAVDVVVVEVEKVEESAISCGGSSDCSILRGWEL